jgi:hypothetical protein
MITKSGLLALALLVFTCLLPKSAAAQLVWDDADRFNKQHCDDQFNAAYKSNIPCQIDHASFEKGGYNPNDLTAAGPSGQYHNSPSDLCGLVVLYNISLGCPFNRS